MSYRLYIFSLAFFIIWFGKIQAQEEEFLDDSTKEVHGLHTTFFITPMDVKFNRYSLRPIEHTVNRIDQFTHRQRSNGKIQDLGNEGTATKNIFYTLPKQIGFHTGFYAYDIYFNDPLLQPYYDTKSPYTHGTIIFANYGSYAFDATHARSFNKNWHVGALFESMLTDREFIPSKIPYDRQVITYPITVFGRYVADKGRYQAMLSFYRKNHRNRETGGIASDLTNNLQDWLKPKAEVRNNLSNKDNIESSEMKQQYFLYHEVNIAEPLQLYHQSVLTNHFNRFESDSIKGKSAKFLSGGFDKQRNCSGITDSTTIQNWSNEWGVKGTSHSVFYQYYYRNNNIKFQKINAARFKKYQENYLGVHARIDIFDDLEFIHLHGEFLEKYFYKIRTAYEGQWVELSYNQMRCQPPKIAQYYNNFYRKWKNNFKPSIINQFEGTLHLPIPYIRINPRLLLTKVQSPIYYKKLTASETISTAIEPLQDPGNVFIRSWGGNVDITFLTYLHIDTEILSTKVEGPAANAFRIPQWYTAIRAYYADTNQEGNGSIETGIEMNWKSDYKGDAYDPITQQFFVQDNFKTYAYPVYGIFFNFRIKTFRGFLKAIHVNQGSPLEGYFVTPFYPGQLRSIDLGVSWSLFD